MAAAPGIVRFHQYGRTVTFRVEGRGTANHSLPMRRQAERFLETAGVDTVEVDLRQCSYMDSTFLGTLLTLKKTLDRAGGRLALVAPSAPCLKTLSQMGLTEMLPAQAAADDPAARWTELSCAVEDPGSFKRNVAQAHEELASLPGPAGEQFQAVRRCLQRPEPPPPSTSRPSE